jgi:hypothetical protein
MYSDFTTKSRIDVSKCYVVAICSNPIRYHSRYRLFKEFEKHMQDSGAKLLTVEVAYGDREFNLTQRNDPYDLQFRTREELWHKENLINLAIQHLCQFDPDWKYVLWVDGDVSFQRQDIIEETVHQLQHYDIVQMFSHVVDLGPSLEPLQLHNGFVWSYFQNDYKPPQGAGTGGYYGYEVTKGKFWHPGYAWGARRDCLDKIQLYDKAILGSGDHHMALGLIGEAARSLPGGVTKAYKDSVLEWEAIAMSRVRKNIGYVPGMISHYWHGKKVNRKYQERWEILTRNKYDPAKDISRDQQGLYRLNVHLGNRQIHLRDDIRSYFRARQEDGIDVE